MTPTPTKPNLLLNPAVAALCWTPEAFQYVYFPNPRYLNSLWLGTVWNVTLLPTRIFQEVINPLLRGYLTFPLIHLFVTMPISVGVFFLRGLIGRCRAVNLPIATMATARSITPEEAMEQFNRGNYELLWRSRW